MVPTNTEVPVVSEVYDEIVFTNPKESFFLDVLAISDVPSIEQEYTQFKHFIKFSDTADMQALLEAQKFIQQQLQITKERYVRLNEELEAVDIEIDNVVMPPPPTPPPITQSSSVVSQPVQQSVPAPSKPRTNTGGSTRPRTTTKGTKNKSAAPAQPPDVATSATTGTSGKKLKTKIDSQNHVNTIGAAAAVTAVSTTTATTNE